MHAPLPWLSPLDRDCSRIDRCLAADRTISAAGRAHRPSGRLACSHNREVNLSLGYLIDVVRPGVEGDVEHDLDQLRIVIAGELEGTDIVLAHMAAFTRHFGCETH